MFFEEIEIDSVLDSVFSIVPEGKIKTQEDINKFVDSQVGSQMPLNKPQWQVWLVPNYDRTKNISLFIWKPHHSLCDGISFVALNLSMDNFYDTGKLVKVNPVPLWRRYLLRALLPISGV